jgi:mannose-1-phosphate guanylyltransferase
VLNENAFEEINKSAVDFAAHINAIVTIGIRPTFPHTGYGYIQHVDKEVAPGVFQVKLFTEKPDVELAQTFFDSGDFLWNAGLFTFKTQHMVTAFEKYLPELHDVFDSLKDVYNTANETAAIEKAYPQCTSISIDFGIMEKAKNVYVIPASFGWSDLGTWASAYENLEKDYLGNAVMGNNVVVYDSHNNIVKTLNDKLVVLQGLEDLIVVDTKDVLLICKKENEPDIKNYIADIKRNKGDKFL